MTKIIAVLFLAATSARAGVPATSQEFDNAGLPITAASSWTFRHPNGIKAVRIDASIDFSTITAALNTKLSSGAIPSQFVDLSTVTQSLNTKLSSGAIPSFFVDLSTVTQALNTKLSSGPVPNAFIDLSTVTQALNTKLSSGPIPTSFLDLSTVTSALNTKLSSGPVPNAFIDLSTVTSALAGKQASFTGISSTCASGFYLTGATWANGVATGGACMADATGGGVSSSSGSETFVSSQNWCGAPSATLALSAPADSETFRFVWVSSNGDAGSRYGYLRFNGDSTAGNHKWSTNSCWDTTASSCEPHQGGTSSTNGNVTEDNNLMAAASQFKGNVTFNAFYGDSKSLLYEGVTHWKFDGFDIYARDGVGGRYAGTANIFSVTLGVSAGTFCGHAEITKYVRGGTW